MVLDFNPVWLSLIPEDQKENQTPISSAKTAVVDTETPATKLARLCVGGDDVLPASPARLKARVSIIDVIFFTS